MASHSHILVIRTFWPQPHSGQLSMPMPNNHTVTACPPQGLSHLGGRQPSTPAAAGPPPVRGIRNEPDPAEERLQVPAADPDEGLRARPRGPCRNALKTRVLARHGNRVDRPPDLLLWPQDPCANICPTIRRRPDRQANPKPAPAVTKRPYSSGPKASRLVPGGG